MRNFTTMKWTNNIQITNEDNMALMSRYPDNYFDLAIVDPPYGIGISKNPIRQQHRKKQWDNNIPNKKYFNELFRVSKNQIIWGGNYFDLPPTQGFFIVPFSTNPRFVPYNTISFVTISNCFMLT